MRPTTDSGNTDPSPEALPGALKDMLNFASGLAWLTDRNGRIVFANARFADFAGPAAGSEGGLSAAIHADDLAAWEGAEKRALTHSEPFATEVRFLGADGEYRWVRLSGVPRFEDGEFAGYAGSGLDIHREKLLEEGLAQGEARWQALVEDLPLMIGRSDARGQLTYVSPAFQAYVGRPLEEIMTDPHGYIHPDDLEAFRDILRASITPGEPIHTEYRVRRADGAYRWHTALASPIRDADGNVTSWVGALLDIHDRREAEEALLASQQQYQSLIDSVPAFFWRTNRSGRPTFMNEHFLRYTGLSSADALAGGWLEVIHPDDREHSAEAWWAAHAAREAYECEHRLRRHDGVYRWHLTRGAPGTRAGGEIAEWNFTCIDIDVRHESENATRRSESLFRALVDASSALVWVANADGTPASPEMLTAGMGRGAGEARSPESNPARGEVLEAIHPDDRDAFVEGWRQAIERQQIYDTELRLRRADGGYGLFRRRAVPVFDGNGRLEYWVGTSTDITEERATADAIRDAMAVKDEFFGLISHEMRSPLATVVGLADILRRRSEELTPEDRSATAAQLLNDAVRLQSLIENMFILARLDRSQVETEPIMVQRLVHRLVSRDSRSPDFGYRVEVAADVPPVEANATWFEQVVENLLTNAEKYSKPGGEIAIRVECPGARDEVVVTVLDQGVGIDPADTGKVFEPFFRSRLAPLHAKGSGLGLSVCKRLVELQGGKITARPRAEGGTEMRFTLPVARESD